MIVLDTDMLTLFLRDRPRVVGRMRRATEEVAITIISRIETLQGRFASLLKAANGAERQRGQRRLNDAERDLARIPKVLSIDDRTAAEFDLLRQNRKVKKIGRADLLIAAIVLANRARLVTRNLKDFRHVPGLEVENWAD